MRTAALVTAAIVALAWAAAAYAQLSAEYALGADHTDGDYLDLDDPDDYGHVPGRAATG